MKRTDNAIQRCRTISTVQRILGGKWKSFIILQFMIFGDLERYAVI